MTLPAGARLGPYEILSAHRRGRDGRGLSRERPAPRSRRRDQGAASFLLLRSRPTEALRAGSARRRRAEPPQHHDRLRHRHSRRRALRRPGAARGRDPAGRARRRPLLAAQGHRLRDPDRAGPRRRAREGHRPPGSQAREPLRHEGRPRQDPRLRPGQADAGRGIRRSDEPPDGDRARYRDGHLGYMSPEQVKARPADARSDIFALGAILYEMLSGQRPFHGDSAGETMAAILKEDPPDLSATNQNISPGLERIVRHCLEKNPERRFHSAHDLAFELEHDLEPLRARSPRRARRGSRRGRWRVPLSRRRRLCRRPRAGAFLTRASARPPSLTYRMLTFRKGTVLDACFAPDGQTVVYSRRVGRRAAATCSRRRRWQHRIAIAGAPGR